MNKYLTAGSVFYGLCIICFGIQQFMYADMRPVIIPEWPAWLHSPTWAYLSGAVFIVSGILICINKYARTIELILGGIFLLFFIVFHTVYQLFIIQYSFHLGLWTDALKELAFAGGAFLLAGTHAKNEQAAAYDHSLFFYGRVLFSVMLISFGIDHFLYMQSVATLVPFWIPGPVFWTYFAGVTLIGSGVSILFNIFIRPVSMLLALMLFLWFIVLHIPRAIHDPSGLNGNEVTSVFEALAFCGIALVIAKHAKER